MAFVTLQTRLRQVLNFANQVKMIAQSAPIRLESGNADLNYLFLIRRKFSYAIINIINVYENDNDLANYADMQFVTSFNLLTRMAGIKTLLQSAIAEIDILAAPYTPQTAPTPSPLVDTSRIGNLVAIFDTMVANIPD